MSVKVSCLVGEELDGNPVKGEVSRKFGVISKPKYVCLTTGTKKLLSSFVINYHPSAIKLSISASGQRQSRSE